MTDEASPEESARGVGRVEAFSDGVVAIIITIMVLELKAPVEGGLEHVWAQWPVFLAYLLSYAYVGVYWVNHHRLFDHARRVTAALLWSNLFLLFALSLVPFSTAYLGEHGFDRPATWLYLATMLLPSIAYVWLQEVIRRTGDQDARARTYHRRTQRKGVFAFALYVAGLLLTFASPWAGVACAGLVALFWMLPQSGIDRLFDGRRDRA